MSTPSCSGLAQQFQPNVQAQQFQHYVQAQLDKISSTITDHSRAIGDFSLVHQKLDRHSRCLGEVDRRIKLLEVYQSQNFSNNQRLFQAQGNIDLVEKRLFMLQDIAQNGSLPLQSPNPSLPLQSPNPSLQNLQLKIGLIEDQISKLKHKQSAIVKFRRDMSPLNCQSTKDVSADAKNDFRNIEKKLKDFIAQRFQQFQTHFRSAGDYREGRKEEGDGREEVQTEIAGANRKTRVRLSRPLAQNTFKNKINQYYHQETAKKDVLEARQKHKEKSGSRNKKDKRKWESKSKSKKKAADARREGVRSSERIALKSVNEYVRLRQNRDN